MTNWNAPGRDSAADELKPGTSLLHGQYTISRFLSSGGFGITYLATDKLGREVVIKECFPASVCFRRNLAVSVRSRTHQQDFSTIVKHFVREAERLARLQHRNIVGVHQVFEENDTAYMALEWVKGTGDLLQFLEPEGPRLEPDEMKAMLLKLLDAVAYLHEREILHRDISPDNILVDMEGEPVLIDFGAARDRAARATRVLSAMHTVKDGYSPYEFYIPDGQQGPASDLYAVAATFYHLITGAAPPPSQQRVAAAAEGRRDPFEPLSSHDLPYDRFFVTAMNDALAIFPKDRMQSARGWIEQIHAEKRRQAAVAAAHQDKQVEAAIFRLVAETNEAVKADETARAAAQPVPPAPPAAAAAAAARAPRPKVRRKKIRPPADRPPETRPRTARPATEPVARAGAPVAEPAVRPARGVQLGLPITGAVVRLVLRLFGLREGMVVKR